MQSQDSVATPHGSRRTQDDDDKESTRPRLAQAASEKCTTPYPINKRSHENQILQLIKQHRTCMPAITESPSDEDHVHPVGHSRNVSSVPGRIHMAKSDMTSDISDGVAFVEVPVRSSTACLGVLPVIRRESLERVAEEDDKTDRAVEAVTEAPAAEATAGEKDLSTSSPSSSPKESRTTGQSDESLKPSSQKRLSTDSSAPGCSENKPPGTDAVPLPSSETDSSSSSSEWSAILEKVKALEPVVAAPQQQRLPSIGSCCCRICQSSNNPEQLISPCRCKGSLAYVHLSCLERWLNQSGRTYCELCQFRFNAIQTPRYRLLQSMRIWYCHPRHRRQLLADALIAVILTCVTLGLVSIIILGIRYFILEGAKLGISAQCTQFTITFFLAVVTSGYMVTMYLLVKDQIMPWLHWWRANVDVRVLIDTEVSNAGQQPSPWSKLNTLSRVWGHA